MNTMVTDNITEVEGGHLAFEQLIELYEWLGLDSDQAATAADADLACGWHFTNAGAT